MCSRILNSIGNWPVTGRNMNWQWPLDTRLYTFPKGVNKIGLSADFAKSQGILLETAFQWQSNYSSVSTIMYGVHTADDPNLLTEHKPYKPYSCFEFACADGMNEKGLAVNALANVDCDYGSSIEDRNLISTLRWAQYVLDSFASVSEAVPVLSDPPYKVINQGMPDSSNKPGIFHLCLSDRFGDSAIVEYIEGKPVVHHNKAFRIATNQPNYMTQLVLNNYWLYQWGLSDLASNKSIVNTSPGGLSSPQLFERASYLLSFAQEQETQALTVAQTRSLMLANAAPIGFNKRKYEDPDSLAPYTVWTNLSDHAARRYYFVNSFVMTSPYLDVDDDMTQCQYVNVMSEDITHQNDSLAGNLAEQLQDTNDIPFSYD